MKTKTIPSTVDGFLSSDPEFIKALEAAMFLTRFFEEKGVEHWKLAGVQSRDLAIEMAPNLDSDTVTVPRMFLEEYKSLRNFVRGLERK